MLLEVKNIKKYFKNKQVKAVDDVSFDLEKGRTLGLVGESGSGKSTLSKLVLRLIEPDEGRLYFEGNDIMRSKGPQLGHFRKKVQVIFQEPLLSLDPRMTVRGVLSEPFLIHSEFKSALTNDRLEKLLSSVELPAFLLSRRPHELSGGECQRVAIARAISLEPKLIVCDEAVSSLDALVQAQILNLLLRLQKEMGVAYLFISHDLRAVRHMSDEVMVMKDGKACKSKTSELQYPFNPI